MAEAVQQAAVKAECPSPSTIDSIAACKAQSSKVDQLRGKIQECSKTGDATQMLGLSMELMNAQQVLTMMTESLTKSDKVKHDSSKKAFNSQGS
jgi:hypothetical protein